MRSSTGMKRQNPHFLDPLSLIPILLTGTLTKDLLLKISGGMKKQLLHLTRQYLLFPIFHQHGSTRALPMKNLERTQKQ